VILESINIPFHKIECLTAWAEEDGFVDKEGLKKAEIKSKEQISHTKVTFLPGTDGSYCHPSYSGGRDQEDLGSKPTQRK
jgi:hypothetical protein